MADKQIWQWLFRACATFTHCQVPGIQRSVPACQIPSLQQRSELHSEPGGIDDCRVQLWSEASWLPLAEQSAFARHEALADWHLTSGLMMQVQYLRQAHENPELRQAHRVHLGTGVIGAGVFFLEYAYPTAPLIHTAWHGLSAASLWSLNALVEDADNRRVGSQFLQK